MTHSTDIRDERSVLITGANSGLGFEAAAQLAELGYDRIILATRSIEKGEAARAKLVERVGRDPFEALTIDVSSIESSNAAVAALIEDGRPIQQLLLNAGVVPGDERHMSVDGIEMTFAASLIGHHILATRLLDARLIEDEGKIVLVSSEGARGDLPSAMGLKLYDFANGDPVEFGNDLQDAMTNFATGQGSVAFEGMRQYAVTKLFSTWWVTEMAERLNGRVTVLAVSPGASLNTNAARHVKGFKRFLFTKLMPLVGPYIGADQPVPVAAKRYVDALTGSETSFRTGMAYMSKPGKMVGPLVEQTTAHLYDQERSKIAWSVIDGLANRQASGRLQPAAA